MLAYFTNIQNYLKVLIVICRCKNILINKLFEQAKYGLMFVGFSLVAIFLHCMTVSVNLNNF